ncbi:hypothetical protein [Nitrosospira sp. NpAV]|uniref:hypothetical protein n=1 Tax=Nitrosospira sp. NpAV TaxID=58133 RepID=UPI0012EC645D|nr:hypothetical protein [Nitrosospira sp. NpAV]
MMNKTMSAFVTGAVFLVSTCVLAEGGHGGGHGGDYGGGQMGNHGGAQLGGYGEAQSQSQGRQDDAHRAERSRERGMPGLNRADDAAGQHGSEGRANARANQFKN